MNLLDSRLFWEALTGIFAGLAVIFAYRFFQERRRAFYWFCKWDVEREAHEITKRCLNQPMTGSTTKTTGWVVANAAVVPVKDGE